MKFRTVIPCVHTTACLDENPYFAAVQYALNYTINWLHSLMFYTSYIAAVSSPTTITQIQGPGYQSPLIGLTVRNLTGIVTAKGLNGFYLAGDPVGDNRVSNGLFVYSTSKTVLAQVSVRDLVSLSGTVAEFRPASATHNDLFLTELGSPHDVVVLSSNNTVAPVILGKDRSPPTQHLTILDNGPDGFLSVPNNVTRLESVNATLQPEEYGLDFWESIEGQLVVVPKPIALGFPNRFGEFWVHGDWPVTGKNSRGGLTMTFGPDGIPDSNPEAILIGTPLDKSRNPTVAVGTGLSDITGVVTYQFGFYYILPLTAATVIYIPASTASPTTLTSPLLEQDDMDASADPCVLTLGDYNVENMAPTSSHLPTVAVHIAELLRTPDIIFVQEIQDNSGKTDDGTVDANITLTKLVNEIARVSNVTYHFVDIPPVDGQDGGIPGGNIRQAYLYRPERLSLVPGSPAGGAMDKTEVLPLQHGLKQPVLSFNPGRIDPVSGAWNSSRKPLVAAWTTPHGQQLFAINVHLSSKGGSSSTEGDARPPVNSPLEQRTSQVKVVADFVQSILDKDQDANIVVAGDFNEFLQTRSVYKPLVNVLTDMDEVSGIPPVERYSYVFDQNCQQLDHVFVSDAIKRRKTEFEHIHINNWAPTLSVRVSDHDPSVGRIRLC